MTAWLTTAGCDAVHTLDLPDKNRTTDEQINNVADREQRVVISKDADFVDGHLLRGRPAKLLLVSTGNISNPDLEALMGAAPPGHYPRIPETLVPGTRAVRHRRPRVSKAVQGNPDEWEHSVICEDPIVEAVYRG